MLSTKIQVLPLLKELRERTGAPMGECKDAINTSLSEGLTEKQDIFDKAVAVLRVKGLATAAKKSGRMANEGLVAAETDDNFGVVVEISSETDFTARNEIFQSGVSNITKSALEFARGQPAGVLSLDDLLAAPSTGPNGGTVGDEVTSLVTAIRENIQIRRASSVKVSPGVVGAYVHQAQTGTEASRATRMGQQVALVGIETTATDKEALSDLGKKFAMQVVASTPPPSYLHPEDVPADVLAKEQAIHRDQITAKDGNAGKAQTVLDKMAEGLLSKFYQEACLMKQPFLISDGTGKAPSMEKVIAGKSEELGHPLHITEFVNMKVGVV